MINENNIKWNIKYNSDTLPTNKKYDLKEIIKINSNVIENNNVLNIVTRKGTVLYGKLNIVEKDKIILIKTKGKITNGKWCICNINDGEKTCRVIAELNKLYFNNEIIKINMFKEHEIFVLKNKQDNCKLYIDGILVKQTNLLDNKDIKSYMNCIEFGTTDNNTNNNININYFYYSLDYTKENLQIYKFLLKDNNGNIFTIKNGYLEKIDLDDLSNDNFNEFGFNDLNLLNSNKFNGELTMNKEGEIDNGDLLSISLDKNIKTIKVN